ncbi:MAG: hypothetical protein GW938_17375 [Leptospira sp.]|nr:hypothetical protein [Leptospira sp.]
MSDTNQSIEDRKVILFLSVDIIGSTSFKNKGRTQLEWLKFFNDFYEQFPLYFLNNLEDTISKVFPNKPEVWKSLGDELIFTFEIENHELARGYTVAFSKSVFNYQTNNELSLKGTAWIAGFPVINAIITSDAKNTDYIGPQIDIGFRLSKFSSNLKFIISVELLLLLVKTSSNKLKFFIEDPQPLKGVLGDKPYPIIWIKNESSSYSKLNNLLKRYEANVDSNELSDYCEEFIKSVGKPFMIPYLKNDPLFNILPDWYEKEYKDIKNINENSYEENMSHEN